VSRGCNAVTSVDQDFGCIRFINQTAKQLDMKELIVIKQDVFRFLSATKSKYDVIFADPPYKLNNISEISNLIFKNSLLNPKGWLIVEHSGDLDLSEELHFFEHRKYGRVNFSFFQME